MKATDLFPGLICYLADNSGVLYGYKVKIVRVGIPKNEYSTRNDHSEIIRVDADEEGRFVEAVYENTDYNQRWYADRIGKPRYQVMNNRRLVSLRDGDEQVEAVRKRQEERERRNSFMEAARTEMTALLVNHGISEEDVSVQARFDDEADAAEVRSVRITGESVERLIEVFRDFDKKT